MIAEAPSQQAYQSMQPYLFSVAYRMTGSASDAEDLVQDAWIRYLDAGSPDVDSLRAYLTTIVSRLALDYLKSARVQRERYIGNWLPEPVLTTAALPGPAESVIAREEVSLAFLTLLERLTPEQRVAYVLREGLQMPYDEIANHLGKSAATCRQIVHRAQLRLTERRPTVAPTAEHERMVQQFVAAFATGDADQIASLLAEDVAWIGDGGPERLASRKPITGIDRVSRGLAGLIHKVPAEMEPSFELADLNGAPAIIIRDHGEVDRTVTLDVRDGKITAVRMVLNLDKLRHLAAALRPELPSTGAAMP